MKGKHSVSLIIAAVALLALSVPAFSQMMDMHGQGRGQMMKMGNISMMGNMNMMGMCIEHADKMGLTDDQIIKMKPLHSDMQKRQARFKADLKIAEIELMEIMDVKDFDMEKAAATVRKIADIQTAHHFEMLKAMREMRTILTNEQFKTMKKIMFMKAGDTHRPRG